MKRMALIILIFALFLTLVSSASNKNKGTAVIIRETKEGYDVYSQDGKLIAEFTRENTDKDSLDTLKLIIDQDNDLKKEKKENTLPARPKIDNHNNINKIVLK